MKLPRNMGKVLLTLRTGLAICRVNLVSCRVYRRAFLKSPLSRPSRRDNVIAIRSRIRLRESNFGEWQVDACKRENSGWWHRETRPEDTPDISFYSREKLFVERNSLFIAISIPRRVNYFPSDTKIGLPVKNRSVMETNRLTSEFIFMSLKKNSSIVFLLSTYTFKIIDVSIFQARSIPN